MAEKEGIKEKRRLAFFFQQPQSGKHRSLQYDKVRVITGLKLSDSTHHRSLAALGMTKQRELLV
jgi:hypothetical protein